RKRHDFATPVALTCHDRIFRASRMGVTIPLLTERAYERVRRDIISCVIAPGSEISEAQLSTQYKMGKAAVRGALTKLSHDGLVRAIPRRGYMVMPITLKDIH